MPTSTGFQDIVNNELPPAVPGDFAGANIYATIQAGRGMFVAPPGGTLVGAGGWFSPTTGYGSNYYQTGAFAGFVKRAGQALITQYLGFQSQEIPGGDAVIGFDQGDFWGYFAAGATAGQKVYFNPLTGALTSAATGGSVTATSTSSTLVGSTGVLTVGGTIVGTIAIGQVVTGASIPPGTYVASLGSGSGGAGTYNLANADGTPLVTIGSGEAVAFWGVQESQFFVMNSTDTQATSSAASQAGNVLTIGGTITGLWQVGQYVGGAGVPANSQILYQITNTGSAPGGAGTYYVSQPATISSEAMTGSSGLVAKISSWA